MFVGLVCECCHLVFLSRMLPVQDGALLLGLPCPGLLDEIPWETQSGASSKGTAIYLYKAYNTGGEDIGNPHEGTQKIARAI